MHLSRKTANSYYAKILRDAEMAGVDVVHELMHEVSQKDLWFLMTVMLGRRDMNSRPGTDSDWLFDRCMEVQAEPDGFLDLWAREYYKSTLITYGLTIQDILKVLQPHKKLDGKIFGFQYIDA